MSELVATDIPMPSQPEATAEKPPPAKKQREQQPLITFDPNSINQISFVPKYSITELRKAQRNDRATFAFLCLTTERGKVTTTDFLRGLNQEAKIFYRLHKDDFLINAQGVLTCASLYAANLISNPKVLILPQKYHYEALHQAHTRMGHLGENKIYGRLVEKFEWPGMRAEVSRFIAACPECQAAKGPQTNIVNPLKPITTSYPNELLQIDFDILKIDQDQIR